MSIKMKVNLLLLGLGIVMAITIAGYNYYEAKNLIVKEALKKGELITSFAMASREYTVKTMRPLAMELAGSDDIFHPEIMGGFRVSRSISDLFA